MSGVGYGTVPSRCDKFVMCYPGSGGKLRKTLKTCPFGQFWNQNKASCVPTERDDCDDGMRFASF